MGKKERDNQLIANALCATQVSVCIALHCFQAQLWIQSTAAAYVGKGEEGTLPTVIWDNATVFER